ncbi:DNA replication terminus site-binding protein [Psychromonas ossibalaenae]|uniref:DNA replication terminus site-binding protein n=1 Tax=Psychromonas ossibalaenae TaxID=444922 RepID=UPI00036E08A3|nr:DNA replication terminus site-binding protein [Psychromonas ossibalaenae]
MNSEYYYIKHSGQLKSDLLQSVAEVRQALSDFSQTVLLQDKYKQKQSVVFSLIDIEEDKVERQAVIFFNDAAVQEALRFIFSFELQTNSIQDTKKLAGFVQTGLPSELLDLHITRINSAKNRCKKIITSIKDADPRKQADLRFYFVHNICGLTYLVTNELYRNLVQISEPVDSIYFGLEKHNKDSDILFPKAKATLRNSDESAKVTVRKKHNSLPVFLAENSELLALNKNGKKNAIRYSYKPV